MCVAHCDIGGHGAITNDDTMTVLMSVCAGLLIAAVTLIIFVCYMKCNIAQGQLQTMTSCCQYARAS